MKTQPKFIRTASERDLIGLKVDALSEALNLVDPATEPELHSALVEAIAKLVGESE